MAEVAKRAGVTAWTGAYQAAHRYSVGSGYVRACRARRDFDPVYGAAVLSAAAPDRFQSS